MSCKDLVDEVNDAELSHLQHSLLSLVLVLGGGPTS